MTYCVMNASNPARALDRFSANYSLMGVSHLRVQFSEWPLARRSLTFTPETCPGFTLACWAGSTMEGNSVLSAHAAAAAMTISDPSGASQYDQSKIISIRITSLWPEAYYYLLLGKILEAYYLDRIAYRIGGLLLTICAPHSHPK